MRTELNIGYKLKFPNRAYEYEITGLLGRGASCFVYLARYTENGLTHKVILKEYNPKSLNLDRDGSGALCIPADCRSKFDMGMERFEQGYKKQTDMRLNSDITNSTTNIQQIHFANNTRYIEMTLSAGVTYRIDEQATDSTLYDFMRRIRSLSIVIGHYHESGYLHLDIKPDNVFAPNSNDGKDVILFDFDSMVEQAAVANISTPLSYTKEWAAMEQINPVKRMSICKATDIFSVGEMIFYRIFGRHSNLSERRSYSSYAFDFEAPIFRNVNPKVFPLLNELLKKTLCNVVGSRYQTTDELIAKLDEIIKLADPKEPYLVSTAINLYESVCALPEDIATIKGIIESNSLVFISGAADVSSQLAKEYASAFRDEYPTIIYLQYRHGLKALLADDTQISIVNFERTDDASDENYLTAKMKKLSELCKEALIIIDNLSTHEFKKSERVFFEYFLSLNCHKIFTTPYDEWEYPVYKVGDFNKPFQIAKVITKIIGFFFVVLSMTSIGLPVMSAEMQGELVYGTLIFKGFNLIEVSLFGWLVLLIPISLIFIIRTRCLTRTMKFLIVGVSSALGLIGWVEGLMACFAWYHAAEDMGWPSIEYGWAVGVISYLLIAFTYYIYYVGIEKAMRDMYYTTLPEEDGDWNE